MFLQNLRPTNVELPSGTVIPAGGILEISDDDAAKLKEHSCVRMWLTAEASILRLCDDAGTVEKVEQTSEERAAGALRATTKQRKLERVAAATDADTLISLAGNEKDPDVLKAINERANALRDQP